MENGTVSGGASTGSSGSNTGTSGSGNSGGVQSGGGNGVQSSGSGSGGVQPHVGQDSRQAVAQTPKPGEENGALTPAQKEFYEIQVNGKAKKYTIDELKARAAKEDASTERFQKAAEIQRKLDERKARYKENPIEAFAEDAREAGLTPEQTRAQFEKWYKKNFIDPESMTAEQKRIAELEDYKAKVERQETDRQEKQRQYQEEQEVQTAMRTLHKDVIDVMKKHFPVEEGQNPSRFFAQRIIHYMKQNIKNGFDAPHEVIVESVNKEFGDVFGHVTRSMPMDEIDRRFPEFCKRMRKYDLERLNKKLNTPFASQDDNEPDDETPTPQPQQRRKRGPKTMADVDAYFNNLRRSR